MKKRDEDKNRREIMTALAMILQIGLAILVCMAMSIGIGWYLDRLLGTKFLLIVFMIIGFLASIRSMLVLTGRYKPGEKSSPEKREKTMLEQYRDYELKSEDNDGTAG